MKCIGCKYYDEPVDACNAEEDDACYADGIDEFLDRLLEYKRRNELTDKAMKELAEELKETRYESTR